MTTDNTRSDARAMATSDAITLLETASRLGAALLTLTRHRRRVRRRALTRGLLHTTTRFWEPRWRARRQHGASQRWVNTVRRPALHAAGSTQVRSAANRKCNHTIHDTRARVHAAGSTQRGAVSGESQMQPHDTRYEGKSTCGGQHTERCGQRQTQQDETSSRWR